MKLNFNKIIIEDEQFKIIAQGDINKLLNFAKNCIISDEFIETHNIITSNQALKILNSIQTEDQILYLHNIGIIITTE